MSKKVICCVALLLVFVSLPAFAVEQQQNMAKPEVLTLQQCLDLAMQNNKQIQEAKKQVEIAENALKEAKAGFWPTVQYQAARDQSDLPQYQLPSGYSKTDFKFGINATLPLYTGGILENNVKLAELQLDAAKEELRKAVQSLTFNVKQAYYNLWLADQVLRVQQSSYDNMDRHYQQMQIRYRNETVSKLDLLRAEVQRDTIKPKVISAKNQVALAKLQLATLIDYPKDQEFTIDFNPDSLPIPESVAFTLSQVLEEAYQNRPEMRQLKMQSESYRILKIMEESALKPNVALSAGYVGVNKDIDVKDWSCAWNLTFSVGGKIYDRKIQAKIDQAKGKEDLAKVRENGLRDQIRLEAEQSLQNLEVSLENIRVNQSTIGLAKESLRMTQIRADNGMATTMDLMDAQLALDQTLIGYYQGIVSYSIAEAKLQSVMGID